MSLGKQLGDRRRALGLGLAAVRPGAGYHGSQWAQQMRAVEQGRRMPRVARLVQWAHSLGCIWVLTPLTPDSRGVQAAVGEDIQAAVDLLLGLGPTTRSDVLRALQSLVESTRQLQRGEPT